LAYFSPIEIGYLTLKMTSLSTQKLTSSGSWQ